jgi:hypothetical protein
MNHRGDILIFLAAVFAGGCYGESSSPANLALSKSYLLSPAPNYPLCTDPGDLTQLTDGKAYGSNWRDKSTVGWRIKSDIPQVTIDLQQVQLVEEVRVHTVGGGAAGAFSPEYAAVLASVDGIRFAHAGTAKGRCETRGPQVKSRQEIVLAAGKLSARARYVKVVLQPSCPLVCLDEIEVLGASGASLHGAADASRPAVDDMTVALRSEEQTFLMDSLGFIRAFLESSSHLQEGERNQFLQKARTLEANLPSVLRDAKDYTDRSAEIGRLRAEIYQCLYHKTFVCLPANPMEQFSEGQMVSGQPADRIRLQLWQEEHEPAAFFIVNCSQHPLEINASVSPLIGPDKKLAENDGLILIRRAVFVRGRGVGSIADALVLQDERPFVVEPGAIVQLWLSVHARGLGAGSCAGSVGVFARPVGKNLETVAQLIPLDIAVDPLVFPDHTSLAACNWAYPKRSEITKHAVEIAADDLRRHYTNVIVIPSRDLAWPDRRASDPSAPIPQSSFSEMDELLRVHGYAGRFLLFMALKSVEKDSGRFGQWMTPAWRRAFTSWLKSVVAHLRAKGVTYDRFALYPFDESLCDAFYQLAGLIREIDPNVQIYANSFGSGPADFERFSGLVDIWCVPKRPATEHPDWMRRIQTFGKPVWVYDADGPGKANDPYYYYRQMAWWAFKHGLQGVGFWVYADTEMPPLSWDDTGTALGYYGVVYGGSANHVESGHELIVPSRRWEAWRQGIEDYEYLRVLQDEIAKVPGKSVNQTQKAHHVLDECVDNVLSNHDDTEAACKARRLITESVLELRRAQGATK